MLPLAPILRIHRTPLSSADKLLAALRLFTFERPEWTIEQAALELQLGVSTVYRYFKSLSDAGLIVAFTPARYVLGPAITQLDRQTRLLDPLITAAKPIMQGLLKVVGAHGVLLLCRLYRSQVMCVHQEALEGHSFATSYERGKLMPLHRGAASKIILAHLQTRFVKSFYLHNQAEMAAVSLGDNWDQVKCCLKKIRAEGVAVTAEELDWGVTGIGAPLFDSEGTILGSLSMVLLKTDSCGETVAQIASSLRAAAELIDFSANANTL